MSDDRVGVVLESLLNGLLEYFAEAIEPIGDISSRLPFILFQDLAFGQQEALHDVNSRKALDVHAEHRESLDRIILLHRSWLHCLRVVVDLFWTESVAEGILKA